MAWTVNLSPKAQRQLSLLDKPIRLRIGNYIDERIIPHSDPIKLTDAMTGSFVGLRRFRVGDYRLVAEFNLTDMTITIEKIGHRRDVYDD
ncbi:MAG: type II toxin-antitoxin system RelE/ParE family toxin [Alphaproteobacteria bacterium]|nr:type II toxin-antitoxin system RelE/ParE family toxin [Alphaproteobacteria bacterium]